MTTLNDTIQAAGNALMVYQPEDKWKDLPDNVMKLQQWASVKFIECNIISYYDWVKQWSDSRSWTRIDRY